MPIKPATKTALENYVTEKNFTIVDSTADENSGTWSLTCPTCQCDFHLRVDSIKHYCYNKKNPVCPECKNRIKIANFEQANNVTCGDYHVKCNDCNLHYHYTGNFFRPFHCYCKLAGRRQDAALYGELSQYYEPRSLSKERVYIGDHRCDIAISREEVWKDEDGDEYLQDVLIFLEIDDQGHFSGKRAERDRALVADFLDNRKDNEFLLRIDSRLVDQDATLLAERIHEWSPKTPVTLAYSGSKNRYHKLELNEDVYELLP